jgi:hypothetical protein
LILPGDSPESLETGDIVYKTHPLEFQSGLGKKGRENLCAFVEKGGRLIAWEKACSYVAEAFNLRLADASKGLSPLRFGTNGSVLRARFGRDDLTRGMPENGAVLHWHGPVLNVMFHESTISARGGYKSVGRIAEDDVLLNGLLDGEDIIRDTPCLLRVKSGKGEIILYTFDPKFRAQTDGTYKLFFNALYVEPAEQ